VTCTDIDNLAGLAHCSWWLDFGAKRHGDKLVVVLHVPMVLWRVLKHKKVFHVNNTTINVAEPAQMIN